MKLEFCLYNTWIGELFAYYHVSAIPEKPDLVLSLFLSVGNARGRVFSLFTGKPNSIKHATKLADIIQECV